MELKGELTDKERLFMNRIIKRKNLSLASSLLSIIIAAVFLIYHGLIVHDLNGIRSIIVLLLLLSGRLHLKQYRGAILVAKMKGLINAQRNGQI